MLTVIDKTTEGIRIYCPDVKVIISDLTEKQMPETTPFTGVSHQMVLKGKPDNKHLIGDVLIMLRNQGGDLAKAIIIEGNFVVRLLASPYADFEAFIVFLQYIFEWTSEYVEENKIIDNTGAKFEVPKFLYSKHQFEGQF